MAVTNKDGMPAEGAALGGIGAGGLVLGRNGRFHHITMNNNRSAEEAIPEAKNAFLGIRLASASGEYTRLLRTSPSESIPLPALDERHLSCRVRYPRIDYRLKDEACPAKVLWSAFSPVIPYDYEAASMPVIFVGIQFTNRTDQPLDASALFNWGDLTGHTAQRVPEEPGNLKPVTLAMNDEQEKLLRDMRNQSSEGTDEETEKKPHVGHNAIEFSSHGPIKHNADGGHCLAARWTGEGEISVLTWDPENAADRDRLAALFTDGLSLAEGQASMSGEARAGAVCCQFALPPGGEARADFALSWYCPRHVVGTIEQGNGYTANFDNATEVALHGLRNLKYFILSTNAWHQGFDASSLPPWLKDSLIRSCIPVCMNGIHSRDEGYGQMADLADRRVGPLEEHWNLSLATMLLYPRFEVYWLAQYAATQSPDGVSFAQYLGHGTLFAHDFTESKGRRVLHTATFILCVCRDYLCTGNIIPLQKGYPRIRQAIADLLEHDSDRDGLPEPAGYIQCQGLETPGLSSPVASLWVAALNALSEAMSTSGKGEDGRFLTVLARRAAGAFETRYWDEEGGYYRFYPPDGEPGNPMLPPSVSHSAQLAGLWATRFLGLNGVFRDDHVKRALDTLMARNTTNEKVWEAVLADGMPLYRGTDDGVASLSSTLPLGCLLVYEGRARQGLELLAEAFRREATFPGRATMQAAWYAYYAVAGVVLHVPRQRLRIAPNLPKGAEALRIPLVTSWCLGELMYQADWRGSTYRQRIQLSFDSPITLREIVLRLPLGLSGIAGRCHSASERIEATFRFSADKGFISVLLVPERPLTVQRELRIELRGQETGQAR